MQQSTATVEKKAAGNAERTIGKLFLEAREQWSPKRVVMRHKRFGIWNKYTWEEHYQRTKDFALGLMSIGFRHGDKVALIGDPTPEVYWSMHGLWCAGGAMVGCHVDAMPQEVKYMVELPEARFVLAKDQEQVDKLLRIKDELPLVERVIWWDPKGMHGYDDPWLSSFDSICELGRAYAKDHPDDFEASAASITPDDLAGVWYTSGSTALPKAVCHSQRSVLNYVECSQNICHGTLDDDGVIFYGVGGLGETAFGSLAMLVKGIRLNIPEHPDTYQADMREIAPSHVMCVPFQWESMVSGIQVSVGEAHPLKQFLFNQFLRVGMKCADLKCKNKEPNLLLTALNRLGEFLIFHPVRDRVGMTRLKRGITTGYTLADQTFMTLRALGMEVRQVYGSTEQGMITAHADGDIRAESVGVPLPGCELKIAPDSELLTHSPSLFVGYYKNPDATEKVLADGWFHTGDSAYIDERGHLFVYGRLSEMGELANGGKYSPQFLEAQLRYGAQIHYAVAIGGPMRDYVTAIVTLDYQPATRWAESRHLNYTTMLDLTQNDEMANVIKKDVQRVNRAVPKDSRIRKFVILHKDFDPDEGEMTRTHKVKRIAVESTYRDVIEAMYGDRTEVMVTAKVTYQDGRTGTVTAAVKVRTVPEE